MSDQHAQRLADRLTSRIEHASWLDGPSSRVREAVSRMTRANSFTRSAFSGTGLGHPAHPALVIPPLGCWAGALAADVSRDGSTARYLTGTGLLLSVPAVATGLSDWTDTTGAEQRVGFVHLLANITTIGLYAASWRARHRGASKTGVILGLLGAITASTAGWLGGHLAYNLGVGIDTTAFDGGPTEWTPVIRNDHNPNSGSAANVPLLIVELDHQTYVLADRCTHRGGPLSEGTIQDGCVTCPWHGSRFLLSSGRIEDGPAVAPQPAYEVRSTPDGLEVRRDEVRSLRTNPKRAPS